MRYFTANGFYVLLDNQFNADDTAKAMPGQWVAWWRQVLQDVIADSASRNQVMLDLLNEPDSQFWKWENAGPAYLQAMDALHQVGPFAPDFLEVCTRPACISTATRSGSGRTPARPTCRPWTPCTRQASLHQIFKVSVRGLHASALPPALEVGERRPGLPAGYGRAAPGRPFASRFL